MRVLDMLTAWWRRLAPPRGYAGAFQRVGLTAAGLLLAGCAVAHAASLPTQASPTAAVAGGPLDVALAVRAAEMPTPSPAPSGVADPGKG